MPRTSLWESLFGPKEKFSLSNLQALYNVLVKHPTLTDSNQKTVLDTLRTIVEIILWGDVHNSMFFDFFLEKNVLSYMLRIFSRTSSKTVKIELIQIMSILVQNVRKDTSVYFLLSNNRINDLIVHRMDYSDDDLLAYYISFLKAISIRLNQQTIQLFFDENTNDFPLYTEAVRFFNHPDHMIRIAVRTLSLNVFRVEDEGVRNFILNTSAVPYFSNLVWFIQLLSLRFQQLYYAQCHAHTYIDLNCDFFLHSQRMSEQLYDSLLFDRSVSVVPLLPCVLAFALLYFAQYQQLGVELQVASHLRASRLREIYDELLDNLYYINDIFTVGVPRLASVLRERFVTRIALQTIVRSIEAATEMRRHAALTAAAQLFVVLEDADSLSSVALAILLADAPDIPPLSARTAEGLDRPPYPEAVAHPVGPLAGTPRGSTVSSATTGTGSVTGSVVNAGAGGSRMVDPVSDSSASSTACSTPVAEEESLYGVTGNLHAIRMSELVSSTESSGAEAELGAMAETDGSAAAEDDGRGRGENASESDTAPISPLHASLHALVSREAAKRVSGRGTAENRVRHAVLAALASGDDSTVLAASLLIVAMLENRHVSRDALARIGLAPPTASAAILRELTRREPGSPGHDSAGGSDHEEGEHDADAARTTIDAANSAAGGGLRQHRRQGSDFERVPTGPGSDPLSTTMDEGMDDKLHEGSEIDAPVLADGTRNGEASGATSLETEAAKDRPPPAEPPTGPAHSHIDTDAEGTWSTGTVEKDQTAREKEDEPGSSEEAKEGQREAASTGGQNSEALDDATPSADAPSSATAHDDPDGAQSAPGDNSESSSATAATNDRAPPRTPERRRAHSDSSALQSGSARAGRRARRPRALSPPGGSLASDMPSPASDAAQTSRALVLAATESLVYSTQLRFCTVQSLCRIINGVYLAVHTDDRGSVPSRPRRRPASSAAEAPRIPFADWHSEAATVLLRADTTAARTVARCAQSSAAAANVVLNMLDSIWEGQAPSAPPLNATSVLSDPTVLLPPPRIHVPGVALERRLPIGEVESATHAVMAFVTIRDTALSLVPDRTRPLRDPARRSDDQPAADKIGSDVDIAEYEAIACALVGEHPNEDTARYIAVDDDSYMLVRPNRMALGTGTITYRSPLKSINIVASDKEDDRVMIVITADAYRQVASKSAPGGTSGDSAPTRSALALQFTDKARCEAARGMLERHRSSAHVRRMQRASNILGFPLHP